MRREMMKALEADGEKLRQLTGEDHGPFAVPPETLLIRAEVVETSQGKLIKVGGMFFAPDELEIVP